MEEVPPCYEDDLRERGARRSERDPEVLRAALTPRDRRTPPRGMPREDADRSRPARARSAGARAGHRGLLRRADEDDGRREREPRVRGVADRRRAAALRPVDGLRGGSAVHAAPAATGTRSAFPRESMGSHLFAHTPGWTQTIEYSGDDPRLPEPVRAFSRAHGVQAIVITPLVLGSRTLGWMTLSSTHASECWTEWWRVVLIEAIARQAALALHQSRLTEQRRLEERRKAILEERNRLARDIHDNLAQGFAAILMQLQAAQREALHAAAGRRGEARDGGRSGPHAPDRGAAIGRRASSERRRRRGRRAGAEAPGRPGAAHARPCRSTSSSTSCRASATASSARSSASRRKR